MLLSVSCGCVYTQPCSFSLRSITILPNEKLTIKYIVLKYLIVFEFVFVTLQVIGKWCKPSGITEHPSPRVGRLTSVASPTNKRGVRVNEARTHYYYANVDSKSDMLVD